MAKKRIAVVPLWDEEKNSIWMLPNYLDGIRDALFEDFESLGIYGCAWTHGTIHRKDFRKSA